MKVAIVGSGGRLGMALTREWTEAGETVIGFDRTSLDLSNPEKVRAALGNADFEVLINCAALTNVDYCESHEPEAFRVNSEAVRDMAESCRQRGARMVHVSTDYVFDGEKPEPYVEDDAPRPLGVYGASKLAGEQALADTLNDSLVVRVSWVFGPDRPSFVDQILAKARDNESVSAVADKWAVPTYTLDLGQWLRPFLGEIKACGILHLCNSGSCTWQEYGQYAIESVRRAGVPLKAETIAPQKMSELKAFVARRPIHTVMATHRFSQLTGRTPRSWQEAVDDYVRAFVVPQRASADCSTDRG